MTALFPPKRVVEEPLNWMDNIRAKAANQKTNNEKTEGGDGPPKIIDNDEEPEVGDVFVMLTCTLHEYGNDLTWLERA